MDDRWYCTNIGGIIYIYIIQSKQSKHSYSPALKKFKKATSVGKVMSSVLGDYEGVIKIDYLEKGKKLLIDGTMHQN